MDAAQPARISSDPCTAAAALLTVQGLQVCYPARGAGLLSRRQGFVALDDIELQLRPGETLAVVGESGSGKSTLARALIGLQSISAGTILYQGQPLVGRSARQWRQLRRELQMVFQDALASFDPRLRMLQALHEPLRALCPELDAAGRMRRIAEVVEQVGLRLADLQGLPHEYSGGQCQRLAIARALVLRPRLLICDEVVSALDVSVQAQIINLLRELQRAQGLALLFISHDLAVVHHLADRVLVLYHGHLQEQAGKAQLYASPRHPYTQALLAAHVETTIDRVADGAIDPPRPGLQDEAGSNPHAQRGCRYAPRCPRADARCRDERPLLRTMSDGAQVRCHHPSG